MNVTDNALMLAANTIRVLAAEAVQKVLDLNLVAGAIVPSQVFVKRMKDNPDGASIINISSMNAFRPLTRIPGYSAAKAAVSNFTQWLAVHLAQDYNPKLRVNAIAPGFFLTEQNRFLLTDEKTGALTARGTLSLNRGSSMPVMRRESPVNPLNMAHHWAWGRLNWVKSMAFWMSTRFQPLPWVPPS